MKKIKYRPMNDLLASQLITQEKRLSDCAFLANMLWHTIQTNCIGTFY